MKRFAHASLGFLIVALCGCAASASFTQTGERYPAFEGPVKVYFEVPDFDYERVGIVSSQGGGAQSRAEMIGAMQEKAGEYGANGIIIISEKTKENLTFAAGEFGAVGGTTTSKNASALAIRVSQDSETQEASQLTDYEPRWSESVSAGAELNTLYFAFSGVGFNAWVGKNRIRVAGAFSQLDTPTALLSDGFENGRVEALYALTGEYFFLDDLSGPYLSTGFNYTENSVGHRDVMPRGAWEDFFFSIGFGYLLRFNRYLYLDSEISLNASLTGEKSIAVGNQDFRPNQASPSAFIGLGVNF